MSNLTNETSDTEDDQESVWQVIEFYFLTTCFVLGCAFNIGGVHMGLRKKHAGHEHNVPIKVGRCIADLLVLLVYVPTTLFYAKLETMIDPTLACKLTKFGRHFAYQLSSNVTVCIAFDRYLLMQTWSQSTPASLRAHRWKQIKLLLVGWLVAICLASPVLGLFKAHPTMSRCCGTIWMPTSDDVDLLEGYLRRMPWQEAIWTLSHLALQSWIPFGLTTAAYVGIRSRLRQMGGYSGPTQRYVL